MMKNNGNHQSDVEKRSFVNRTSYHIFSAESDDEDDSGVGTSLLHNTSNVQHSRNNELIIKKKKSSIVERDVTASVVNQSKHQVKNQASTSYKPRRLDDSDDYESDFEVPILPAYLKRRSGDNNDVDVIPKKKKKSSSKDYAGGGKPVNDDISDFELSDEDPPLDQNKDEPTTSLPKKETRLAQPKKDDPTLYNRQLSVPNEFNILNTPDDFVFIQPKNGKPQLYIFVPGSNKRLCYKFTRVQWNSSRYRCLGCFAKSRKINVRTDDEKQLYVSLSKKMNGEYYVQMGTQKHCCQPIEYEPDKNQENVLYECYEFQYYRRRNKPDSLNLAIVHPENKELFYPFFYLPSLKYYQCIECQRQKKKITMTRKRDGEGDDYFIHDFSKHICKPLNVSFLNGFIGLGSDGKFYEDDIIIKKRFNVKKEIDGSGFELRPRNDFPNGTLIVYHPEDRSLCYEYIYKPSTETYNCCKCLREKKICVTAKLVLNEENGEMHITLGKNEHVCAPQRLN